MDAVIIVVILGSAVAVTFHRHPEPAARARALQRVGMTLMTLTLASMGLFVALQDPGGWAWAGAVAGTVIPLAALAAFAWFRPGWALPLLALLTMVAVVGIAVDGDIGELEGVGAVSSIALTSVAVGATALGHQRAWAAGMMLVAIGLTPIVLGIQTVYMMPAVGYGALYLLSGWLDKRQPAPKPRATGQGPLRTAT